VRQRLSISLLGLLLVFSLPAAADPTWTEGFAGSAASLGTSMGIGTLVENRYARTPLVTADLDLMPRYKRNVLGVDFALSLRELASFELTRPDNPSGTRATWSDLYVTLSTPKILAAGEWLTFTPGLRYVAPISRESLWSGSRGDLVALGVLGFKLGGLEASWSASASKGLRGHTSRLVTPEDAERDSDGRPTAFCRAGAGACGSLGMNMNWAVRNALEVGYSIGSFSFSATYILINQFNYAAVDTEDAYTPQKTDSSGRRVAQVGAGRADQVWGVLGAEWEFSEGLALSLELLTIGPAKTADNQSLRFPFFDFVGPADNLTQVSVGVAMTL